MNRAIYRLMAMLLAIVPFTVEAQNNIMSAFNAIIKSKDAQVTQIHSLSKNSETGKKEGQCDVYRFILPKDKMSLVMNVLNAFEKDSQKAYNVTSGKWERKNSEIRLAVGDGSGSGEHINERDRDYIYALFLAPKSEDREGIYRYAYAFNYGVEKNNIVGKIVITYSTTLQYRQQQAYNQSLSNSVYYSGNNAAHVYVVPPVNTDANTWFETFMTHIQSMTNATSQTRIALATKVYGLVRDISQYSKVTESDKAAARDILKGMIADQEYSETILNKLLNQCLTNLK